MQPSRGGIRVLVVEDDDNNRHAMGASLMHAGYDVRVAANGQEAIRLSREGRPDVVLMDLVMPGLNGVDAAAMLKQDPTTAAARVIAVTGSWLGSKPEWLQETGFDGAVRKPCTMHALLAEVDRVLGSKNRSAIPLDPEIAIGYDG